MEKKIKITEEQLKMLMERKHSYKDDIEEQVDGEEMDNSDRLRTKESALFEFERKFNELISLSKKIDELSLDNKESWREWITNDLISLFGGEDNPFEGQRGGPTVSSLIDDELGRNQEDEDEEEDLPTPPSEEETQDNQVYESIKASFKRFL